MNTLGVILARGGSKRVKGKNLRRLQGVPLLVWTIYSAARSAYLDRFVVSSDSDEILKIAKDFQVTAIRRPPEMATDDASSYPALLHAIEEAGGFYDNVCLLQPTSPFRHWTDIDTAIALLGVLGIPALASATGKMDRPNGAVYVANINWLRDALTRDPAPFDGPCVEYFEMPEERSIDINTEADFMKAETLALHIDHS